VHYQDIPTQQHTVMVVNQIDNNNYQRTHKYTVYYQDIPTQQHTVMVVNQTDKKQLSTTSQTYSVLSRHTSSTTNSNGGQSDRQ
jgi:hypothetical protein